MRCQLRGNGYVYFSGPMKELCDYLEAASRTIFRFALNGFVDHGRGAVLWEGDDLGSFIPQAKLVSEIDDRYATERLARYQVAREALVYVRYEGAAALYELAARRPNDDPKSDKVVVYASVLWSRGFAASAEEAEARKAS
jgi:hypothetical protein